MKKLKKGTILFLKILGCHLLLLGSLKALPAFAATDQAESQSIIEIYDKKSESNEQNPIKNVAGSLLKLSTAKHYPQTNDLKMMGISFLGMLFFLTSLFLIFWKRSKEGENEV